MDQVAAGKLKVCVLLMQPYITFDSIQKGNFSKFDEAKDENPFDTKPLAEGGGGACSLCNL